MEIEFRDERLELIETDRAAETRLPVAVIKSCRKKLNFIRQAVDERDVRNWKSLRVEKMQGDESGKLTIRLNDQWRMFFVFEKENGRTKFVVLDVRDPH